MENQDPNSGVAPQVDSQEPLAPQTYEQFIAFHGIQLYAVKFPQSLQQPLFDKLRGQVFDIGSKVKIIVNEEEEKVELVSTKNLKANEDVFLIDHSWTFKFREAEKTLRENTQLLERMLNLVQFSEKLDLPNNPYAKKRPPLNDYLGSLDENTKVYDLDDYELTTLEQIPFCEAAEEISLFNNQIENPGMVTNYLVPLPNLRALWLNNNPLVDTCVNFNQIGEFMPKLEILNSKFTSKAGEWAILFYARDQEANTLEDIIELNLNGRGVLQINDLAVFDRMISLTKLNLTDHPEIFKTEEQMKAEQEQLKEGVSIEVKENIDFVQNAHHIDELLSKLNSLQKLECDEDLEDYILQKKREQAEGGATFLPKLLEINRIPLSFSVKSSKEEIHREKDIRRVMDKIWMYVGTYRIVSENQMDEENVWYITDEVGTSMKHSDKPNFEVHPFIYSPSGKLDEHTITYSISWPVYDLKEGDVIYRDFLAGYDETRFRSARLSVWFNTPTQYFEEQLKIYRGIKPQKDSDEVHQHYQKSFNPVLPIDKVIGEKPIKVFADYVQIQEHLTDPRFVQVGDPKEAHIVWMTVDYYNIVRQQIKLDESQHYFNQFQYEGSFVMKHHLANMIRLTLKAEDQGIIQDSIVLEDYLPAFIGNYLDKQKKCEENTWIMKPINMARSMDTWVSSNLTQILRLAETGPKIAQKYIHNPLLFKGRKMDLRFVALLKSVLPLEVYVYDEFYTRHSNNPYSMTESSFSEYETHFTVMNYKPGVTLQNRRYFEFEKEFNEEYEGVVKFQDIKVGIHEAIKKLFVAFQVQHGKDLEKVAEANRKCRSIYGIDIMVTDKYEPKILEATFSPDCKRACRFNPDFFNEVFGCLFFQDTKNVTRII